MAISPLNSPPPLEASRNDPLMPVDSTQRTRETEQHEVTGQHEATGQHETAGHAASNGPGTTPQTETKFLPLHVFNPHHMMNPMGNPRRTQLQERRERSKLARPEKTRRGGEISADDVVVPVSGRARTAEVSLTLNLSRDPSGDEQQGGVGAVSKARKPNPTLQPYLFKTAEKGQADLSPEDASRVSQPQDGDEPGQTTLGAVKLHKLISEKFPTWGELRQALQTPKKLEEELDPKKLQKLKTVTSRELRSGSIREHTTINGFVSELTGLSIITFFNRLVRPENCEEAVRVSRRMSESNY